MKRVKTVLTEAVYVGGRLCGKGEEVEIREDLLTSFPVETQGNALESLLKSSKAELVAKAEGLGITTVPDSWTKEQIAKAIIEA